MLIYAIIVLLAFAAAIRPLQNVWFVLHIFVLCCLVYLMVPSPQYYSFKFDSVFVTKIIAAHIVSINVVEFFLYYLDKQRAKNSGYRIPEKTLLAFALLGATPAAFLASKFFRHKTNKKSFNRVYWLVLAFQIFAAIVFAFLAL